MTDSTPRPRDRTGDPPGAHAPADIEPEIELDAEQLPMLFGDDYIANPALVWERLLRDGAVHRVATPDGPPAWVVTSYPEVRAGLLDSRLSVSIQDARGGDYKGFALPPALQAHLLNREPPDHTRLRALVSPALAPQRIDHFRSAVQAAVDALVDPIAAAGRGDLVADLAGPLPLIVICDLLGVPAHHRTELLAWAGHLLAAEPTDVPRARDTLAAMLRIVTGIIDARRQDPGEDLLSTLTRAHDQGGVLSTDELTSMVFYLLFVWYEPTVDLLSNGVLTLINHPDLLALLRRRPGQIPAAVEEVLRHEAPQGLAAPRFPTCELEIAGTRIPAGDTVLLSLAAANLDPSRFPAGSELDLDHATTAHLSFGHGVHTCLGAPLVRLQTEITIATLLRRCDDLRLEVPPEQLRWRPGFRHRGLRELPVTACRT